MTATAAGGTRYSVHDHRFDFSQPPVACTECHDAGDERLGKTPSHQWNIQPVRFPQPLTTEQACKRCHAEKDPAWIAEKLKLIRRRL
jgi:hypothetical protein